MYMWELEHVLDRHENPFHKVRIYPIWWDEVKWWKEEAKNQRARAVRLTQERDMIHQSKALRISSLIRVVAVLEAVSEKQQMHFRQSCWTLTETLRTFARKKEHLTQKMEEQRINLRTCSALKNSIGGVRSVAVSVLRVGEIDEISSDALVYCLLLFMTQPNKSWKANRKVRDQLMPVYREELQNRGIDPSKANLQLYMQQLTDEQRKHLFA